MAKIIVLNGNPDNSLDLSDKGRTEAGKNEVITWEIAKGANVASITAIELKTNTPDVFSTRPQRDGDKWKGKIKGNAADHTQCHYSIAWIGENGTNVSGPHVHDPIISIKPSGIVGPIVRIIVIALLTVMGLFMLNFLRGEKRNTRLY